MSRSDDQRLADILDCAAELADVVSRGHQAFLDDPSCGGPRSGLLEIIGEAAAILSNTTTVYRDVPWRDGPRSAFTAHSFSDEGGRAQDYLLADRAVRIS